jgi:tRNA threonylcarbamoyladenosine biosynthesis protein TsaE
MTSKTEDRDPGGVAIHVRDEADLPSLAGRLASALPAAAFVALVGDLGAGKTTFVKAVAAAAGYDPAEVVSPTFGLIHEHGVGRDVTGRPRIVHADMYRLQDAADLQETGWEDAVAGPGWVFVEWPERIDANLPADRLDVSIAIDGPQSRTFTFVSRGPGHDSVVAALRHPGR